MLSKFTCCLLLILLVSCKTVSVPSLPSPPTTFHPANVASSDPLTVLSSVGGLCLAAGMVLIVISRGKRGWYAVAGGIIFIILNVMVAKYDDYIFYPLVVFTGIVSGAWTYKLVRQILMEKKSR